MSISSHTREQSVLLAPQSQSVNPYKEAGPVPPPANWDPTLMELWVKFSDHPKPVFRWFRECAGSLMNTFFASNGELRYISRGLLLAHIYATTDSTDIAAQIGAVTLHSLLHLSVRNALTTYHLICERSFGLYLPVSTEREWKLLISQKNPLSLPYIMECQTCGEKRRIRRLESSIVERLLSGYVFRCRDIGAECHEELNSILAFVKCLKLHTPSSDPYVHISFDASMMCNASPSTCEPEGTLSSR